MKITELLTLDAIQTKADVANKEQAISTLIDLHDRVGHLSDRAVYAQDVLAREAECVTAVGYGLAIPHAKSKAVKQPGLTALTVPEGLDCKSLDGKPSQLFFMIAAPEDGDLHLEILSGLVSLLMDEGLRTRLVEAETPEVFLEELRLAEEAE